MRQLQDVQVEGMALVRRPANKKRFLTKKSEEAAVAKLSEQVAAPDAAISDAIDAIRLSKGESEEGHEALHAAAHLLAGRADLSHEDAVAFVDALALQKAAKKDEEDEDEEQDESDDEENGEEDEGDMPEFLKRKLKKADWEESQHPRDDHGRFGEGGGGGGEKSSGQGGNHSENAKAASAKADRYGFRPGRSDRKAAAAAHKQAADAHSKAATAAAEQSKGGKSGLFSTSGHDIGYHNQMANMHAMRAADLGYRENTKKFAQSAELSANQGGPMEAESREFVSKSDHEALLERLSKSELELADIRGREELRLEKSANEEAYGHLEVDHDALADVTLSLRKASDKKLDALATILKAANEQVRVAKASGGSPFRPQAIRGGVAKSQAASLSQFQQMVSDHQKANPGVTAAQAVTAVAKSAEGLAAYRASKGEN